MTQFRAFILEHSVILDSIIGWESKIGDWSRVEGTLPKINPDQVRVFNISIRVFLNMNFSHIPELNRTVFSMIKDVLSRNVLYLVVAFQVSK